MYCLVSTFSQSFDELGLLYYIPSFLDVKEGQILEVPIGNKIDLGVVLKIGELKELNFQKIDEGKIKSIVGIKNEKIFLTEKQIELIFFIAKYYFSLIHKVLVLFFPKNLRDKIKKDKLILKNEEKIKYSFNFNKILSEKQKTIYEKINFYSEEKNKKKFLLHGVTGSGKTEIYIKLIKKELDNNKQSLLLIPEIVLTTQLETRLKKVFGDKILVINSSLTDLQKTKAWLHIYNCQAKIIIGTRSALFYPYKNLGLIIIDEEHDSSYISNKSPRYSTIEIANKMSNLYKIKLILATGTPSIESMYKAIKGEYILLKLFEKYNI